VIVVAGVVTGATPVVGEGMEVDGATVPPDVPLLAGGSVEDGALEGVVVGALTVTPVVAGPDLEELSGRVVKVAGPEPPGRWEWSFGRNE
jgi:hypothetical protein